MQNLITSDQQIKNFLPNLVVTAKGSPSWLEKLTPFIENAIAWLESYIVEISMLKEDIDLHMARKAVVFMAWADAAPQLDLVATPNGFGIVSTDTIAPASAQRVEAAIKSARTAADRTICMLISRLKNNFGWKYTEYAENFKNVFGDPDLYATYCEVSDNIVKSYFDSLPLIAYVETEMAKNWFSAEVVNIWSSCVFNSNFESRLQQKRISIARKIAAQLIRGKESVREMVSAIFDTFRFSQGDKDSEAWIDSEYGDAFNNNYFTNEKNSSGYFF